MKTEYYVIDPYSLTGKNVYCRNFVLLRHANEEEQIKDDYPYYEEDAFQAYIVDYADSNHKTIYPKKICWMMNSYINSVRDRRYFDSDEEAILWFELNYII